MKTSDYTFDHQSIIKATKVALDSTEINESREKIPQRWKSQVEAQEILEDNQQIYSNESDSSDGSVEPLHKKLNLKVLPRSHPI